MTENTTPDKAWRAIRIIAASQVILAPVIYLIVAWQVGELISEPTDGIRVTVNILLVLGVVQPLLAIPIQRAQLGLMQRSGRSRMTAHGMFQSLTIIKLAPVGAIFAYGFIASLFGAGINVVLWFYALGAIWSLIQWPRREQFDAFLKKMETT